jgi:hypothetical protein
MRRLLEVLIREIAEHQKINVVVGKRLGLLPETEPLKPFRDLRHRVPRVCVITSVSDQTVKFFAAGVPALPPRRLTAAGDPPRAGCTLGPEGTLSGSIPLYR